ncbi:MAG TPA: DUF222 domain-containing protein [Acidimicrobiales bacterium]|jgi:hypothetical protein|nr:DUF222 domain-containing protein [Acidimicrobiales bacterium]
MPAARTAPDEISAAAALSRTALGDELDALFRQRAALDGRIVARLGEAGRQEVFRDDGATSLEIWAVERFGISTATARALTRVAEKAWGVPRLVGSLCAGDVSFDKVRVVADVATPETDRALCEQARAHSVRELADIARTIAATRAPEPADRSTSLSEHDRRSVRFNDQCRTMTVQLPAESYAETKSCLEARARAIPSDGETRWDQRLCDAHTDVIRSSSGRAAGGSPYVVVVHVPLATLVDGAAEPTALAGELERDGLIDTETVQRVACDATIAVAVDDDVGHTMYEGRARREPTQAQRREVMRRDRQCRFPGCTHVTFADIHHVVPWKPGGRTDLENLALLCRHHHHLVHSTGWTLSGNANHALQIVSPAGRTMMSRPSPLWTRVTAGRS